MKKEKLTRIILVDDDEQILNLVTTFLEKQGFKVAPFGNGVDALIDFHKYGADLVLSDIKMPAMDGAELLRNIHIVNPDLPVILITGHADLEIAIEAIRKGAFDFIVKPFNLQNLLLSINRGIKYRRLTLFKKDYKIHLEKALTEKTRELEGVHSQMVLSEKMASIGQLSAGVAHEINNPVGFIASNLSSMNKYISHMLEFLDWQAKAIQENCPPDVILEHENQRKLKKIEKISKDMFAIVEESLEGVDRIKKIVASLKSFCRNDDHVLVETDLNELIERSITMVWHEIKYVAGIERKMDQLPLISCFPSEISQVIMNLLVNASHAIDKQPGTITVRTWAENDSANISISDNGCGISQENIKNIFTPFFTTKEAGKGTGLGLSISYDIIKKHLGEIKVDSAAGVGTTFTITLPVNLNND